MQTRIIFALVLFLLIAASGAFGQLTEEQQSWNRPVEPFKIIGNVYYVGASDITSFLITTPKGHILIDSGFKETVPQITANIKKLGFELKEIKYLLNSHAHFDHAGGLAELKRLTGAKLLISENEEVLLANGGKGDPHYGDRFPFEPAYADETFRDGRRVRLGGTTLTAHITPGHTRGCTTWTTNVKVYQIYARVVFVCSTSTPGYDLMNNVGHPTIVSDLEATFARLRRLEADVFLGSHGRIFGLEEKLARMRSGSNANPFIDVRGYIDFIDKSEADLREKVRKQAEQKR